MSKIQKPLVCIWDFGTPHSENVSMCTVFFGKMSLPICEKHLKEHLNILILKENNYDLEQVMREDNEWRQAQVDALVAAGIDISKVEP